MNFDESLMKFDEFCWILTILAPADLGGTSLGKGNKDSRNETLFRAAFSPVGPLPVSRC